MKRLAHLDVLRLISVALVMYGHFVLVAGGAKVIPNIIGPTVALPLIDESRWKAYLFEVFLIEKCSTQAAILGVSLFFLITGYLMPMMCDRYSRLQFIVNRLFRIVPTLVVGVVALGIFLQQTQGIVFSLSSYLASITLTYEYLEITPVAGVLWTLVIEMIFYFLAFLVGRFTLGKLVFVQGALLALVCAGFLSKGQTLVWLIGYQARYLLMITIGSAFYLAEKEESLSEKISTVLPSVVFSFVGFQLFKTGGAPASSYENLGNLLLASAIFVFFTAGVSPFVKRLPFVVGFMADMVYPIYLVHSAVGLVFIAFLRNSLDEAYLLLAAAIVSSLVIAFVLHVLVETPGINLGRTAVRALKARTASA